MKSFSEFLKLHEQLDELFAEHQYALLHFDFSSALEKLMIYESALLAHMTDEEEIFLPLYAERATIGKGGAVKLFLDEHEKMRLLVAQFAEVTTRLQSESNPEPTILTLLDRESFFKRLCSHHDIREGDILYPALDGVTTMDERAAIFDKVAGRTEDTDVSPAAA